VKPPIYDAGALIAAERGTRRFALRHRGWLELGVSPIVPVIVLAQIWTGEARHVFLHRALQTCEIETFDEERARAVGRLRALCGHSDIVDVSVVEAAIRHGGPIITSDPGDIATVVNSVPNRFRPRVERI
jgi:predicted nucleic acid-binding protein